MEQYKIHLLILLQLTPCPIDNIHKTRGTSVFADITLMCMAVKLHLAINLIILPDRYNYHA